MVLLVLSEVLLWLLFEASVVVVEMAPKALCLQCHPQENLLLKSKQLNSCYVIIIKKYSYSFDES
jgi:hypothetical protein